MDANGNGALSDGLAPRIFLRPIGSPLTVAMSGLAVASLVQSGLDLKWVASDQTHEVGLILIAVPFVLQLLACVFGYLARDGAAGAAFGLLAASWLGLGLIHLTSYPGTRSGAMGLMLLSAGGLLILTALALAMAKPLPGVVIFLTGARFVLAGIYELGAASVWQHVAAIVGLVVTGLAAYAVIAFELEGMKHRPLLPTFRRGTGRAAISGSPQAQLDGVVHEPGVRQTT